MSDLTEFLQARLAEDEQAAREAADHDSGRWFMGDKWNIYRAESEVDEVDGTVTHDLIAWGNAKPQSEHIARHDPARTLADIEAKRRIIAEILAECEGAMYDPHRGIYGKTLRLLAQPHADHPGYDPGWKP